MKTALFTVMIICAAAVTASAQEQQVGAESRSNGKFGIKGGLNLTNLYVEDASTEKLKAGFNAGIFWKLAVAKGFSIQPEVLYSQKGTKTTYDNFIQGDGEYRFNLNYLEVPLLAVVNLGKNFNIQAGPYVGYLLSANVKDMNNDGTINGAADLNEDNFERWDYGVAGGLGFDVSNFTLGARYNYGLREIGKAGLAGEITRNSKNAGLSVYIGLGF